MRPHGAICPTVTQKRTVCPTLLIGLGRLPPPRDWPGQSVPLQIGLVPRHDELFNIVVVPLTHLRYAERAAAYGTNLGVLLAKGMEMGQFVGLSQCPTGRL